MGDCPDGLAAVHGDAQAGVLTRSEDGRSVVLRYSDGCAGQAAPTPLSVSAPCEPGPHETRPWIAGLLPDIESIRKRWRQEQGARSSDAYDLLATGIGRDCAGAFRFCPVGQVKEFAARPAGEDPLTEEQVADKIRQLRHDFGAWHHNPKDRPRHYANAFTLAGGQPKTALRHSQGGWSIPYGDEPTTHIIKPSVRHNFPDLDIVEHLTQSAARRLGLPSAKTECVDVGGERTLLVHRYDRVSEGGAVRRVHQEDLCQAAGMWPNQKYQEHGGPSPRSIARLVRSVSDDPEEDVARFRDALLFNWLFVCTDGHSKNYSLLLEGASVRMAPLYDVISFLPYAQRHPLSTHINLAMSAVPDYSLGASDNRGYWDLMSRQLGLQADDTLDAAHRMIGQAQDALVAEIDLLAENHRSSKTVNAFYQRIGERAGQCRTALRPTRGGRTVASDASAASGG